MRHEIPLASLGPHGPSMASAVERCVHCGFCLPACPTYQVLGEEMDSPRGRIILMKEVLEGRLSAEEAAPFVDRCLGCMSCVTACPSGVDYGALLTAYRGTIGGERPRSFRSAVVRRLALDTVPHPARLRLALRLAMLARGVTTVVPALLRPLLALAPTVLPRPDPLPGVTPAQGRQRARVVLLPGCAQQVLAPGINRATVRVLAANGVEVVVPEALGCCGALAAHTGELDRAKRLAATNIARFGSLRDVDAIVTNAAGCGSGMHEYPMWFAGDGLVEQARDVAARTVDVCVFLSRLGTTTAFALPAATRVAYHDACHLAHAQGVRREPRALLHAVQGLELVELADGETCCGSAGTYNLEQPDIASTLGARKARLVAAAAAPVLVTGNIGCLMQIRTHLAQAAPRVEVLHTVELLARALPPGATA